MSEFVLVGFFAVILVYLIGYGYGAIVSIINHDEEGR